MEDHLRRDGEGVAARWQGVSLVRNESGERVSDQTLRERLLKNAEWLRGLSASYSYTDGIISKNFNDCAAAVERAVEVIAYHESLGAAALPSGETPQPADIVQLLTERAHWYRDGCDGLEDVAGYYASDDCARDAANDLETALLTIRRLTGETR